METAEHLPTNLSLEPEEMQPRAAQSPSPNNPPWGVPIAVGLWILSVLLILLLPSLFLLPYIATLDPHLREPGALMEFARNDRIAILLQVISIIPAHIFTLLAAWLIVTRNRAFSFRKTLGWESGGLRWWHYVVILGAFLVIAATVSRFVPEQDNDLLHIIRSSRAAVYIVAFLATFTAPLVEEVVYRGVLYSAFQRSIGVPAAFLLVTFLFAVVHVPQYYPSYSTIFLLSLLSVTLTGLRVRSKNLLPCIILHMLFNGLQSIMIILDSSSGGTKATDAAAVLFGLLK